MNKKAIAATTITGTGATATATTLATQGTGGTTSIDSTPLSALPIGEDSQTARTSDSGGLESSVVSKTSPLYDFKNKARQFLLSQKSNNQMNIDSFTGGTDIGNYDNKLINKKSLTPHNSLLGNYYVGKYGDAKSFLEIKVEKEKYKNGKGSGKLTGLWSFFHSGTRGNKGFVTFNEAETSGKDKKLILTGGFYVIEKNGSDQKGVISYSKEVKKENNKTLDKSNFDKYFPKPYWYTKNGGFDKYGYDNWGFMNGVEDLNKICAPDDADCKVFERHSKHTLKGEGAGDSWYGKAHCNNGPTNAGCDYIWSWSGDRNSKSELQGFDHMYGNVGQLRLRDHLNPFYRGSWKQVSVTNNIKK